MELVKSDQDSSKILARYMCETCEILSRVTCKIPPEILARCLHETCKIWSRFIRILYKIYVRLSPRNRTD